MVMCIIMLLLYVLVKALPRVLYGKYSTKKSDLETNIAQGEKAVL